MNALLGGSLDVTYIGSGPAINAFAKSDGQAVRLIAGATAGGAQLVVKPEITSPDQLKGRTHRHPAAGQHPGHRAQEVARRERPDRGRRPGRRSRSPTWTTRAPWTRSSRAAWTAAGCPSRGARGWCWTPARACCSTRPRCGRTASSRPPCCWCAPSSCSSTRTPCAPCCAGTSRPSTRPRPNPAEAKNVVNQGLQKLTGNALAGPVIDRAFAAHHPRPGPAGRDLPAAGQGLRHRGHHRRAHRPGRAPRRRRRSTPSCRPPASRRWTRPGWTGRAAHDRA